MSLTRTALCEKDAGKLMKLNLNLLMMSAKCWKSCRKIKKSKREKPKRRKAFLVGASSLEFLP